MLSKVFIEFFFFLFKFFIYKIILAAQAPPNPPPVVLNNAITANQGYQLVMDPRLGIIVGAVNPPVTGSSTPPTTTQKVYQGKVQVRTYYSFFLLFF